MFIFCVYKAFLYQFVAHLSQIVIGAIPPKCECELST